MVVAIHQPNFFPWLGYFDKIVKSDVFVIIDDVQFSKGSVANRNKIKNSQGNAIWVTVPVRHKGSLMLHYNQLQLDYSKNWNINILNVLKSSYSKSAHYKEVFSFVEKLLMESYSHLAALNISIIKAICERLQLTTPLFISSELKKDFGEKNERNLNICLHFHATTYLSGQGAKKYNEEGNFIEKGINLKYQEFDHPIYPQMGGPFISNLSIVDALFNCGFEQMATLLKANSSPERLNNQIRDETGITI